MSLVSSVISQIRAEVADDDSIRWTDAQILAQIRRAANRANLLFVRHGIEFAKSSTTFTATDGLATYPLPSDFKIPYALWNRTDDYKLIQITDEEYEFGNAHASEAEYWRISGTNIEIVAVPDAADSYIFYYWPDIVTSAYTTATTMPWGGRVDDMIIEYTALRLKNIDEMTLTLDTQLSAEFEQSIITAFGMLTPIRGVEGYTLWV